MKIKLKRKKNTYEKASALGEGLSLKNKYLREGVRVGRGAALKGVHDPYFAARLIVGLKNGSHQHAAATLPHIKAPLRRD